MVYQSAMRPSPRLTLKQIPLDYLSLPSIETAKTSGYYWDARRQYVVAIRHDFPDVLNEFAFITKEALDSGGLFAFIEWEQRLWG